MEKLRGAVRPIVTLLFAIAAVYGSLFTDRLSSEQFYSLLTLVIGFYFIQRSAGKGNG